MARFFLSAAALVAIFVAASASPMRRMQVGRYTHRACMHASVQGWLPVRVRQGMEGRGCLGDRLAGESLEGGRPTASSRGFGRSHALCDSAIDDSQLTQPIFAHTHTLLPPGHHGRQRAQRRCGRQ